MKERGRNRPAASLCDYHAEPSSTVQTVSKYFHALRWIHVVGAFFDVPNLGSAPACDIASVCYKCVRHSNYDIAGFDPASHQSRNLVASVSAADADTVFRATELRERMARTLLLSGHR